MGIDYKPIFCIGREFEDKYEPKDYCIEKGLCTEDDVDDADGYIVEVTFVDKDIKADNLDSYSGYGYVVGYMPSVRDLDNFAENVKSAQEKWLKFTGDKAEIIHTVSIY